MKLIKFLLLLFIFSCVFAISGVKANSGMYTSFSNVKVPAIGGTYKTSNYNKTVSGTKQTLYTVDMTTSMRARTYATLDPVGYTSYVTLAINQTKDWGFQNSGINQYRLEIKCVNRNLLQEGYWGTWKYNWPN